jgi:hypothetical protein
MRRLFLEILSGSPNLLTFGSALALSKTRFAALFIERNSQLTYPMSGESFPP